jgi:hypothetical protein
MSLSFINSADQLLNRETMPRPGRVSVHQELSHFDILLSLEAAPAWIIAGANVRDRLAHDHEARSLKMRDKPLGDDFRHSFGCLRPRQRLLGREGERKASFDIVASGVAELVIIGHCRTIAQA